jgi:hypothetical protein
MLRSGWMVRICGCTRVRERKVREEGMQNEGEKESKREERMKG